MRVGIRKSTIKLMTFEIMLIMLFTLNFIFININNLYVISALLFISIFIVTLMVGFEKNRLMLKSDATLNMIAITVLFQTFLYLSGLFVGFLNNGYEMNLVSIIKKVFSILLIIILSEILRYSINQKGRESKIVLILSCLLFTIVDCSIGNLFYDLSSAKSWVEFICLVCFSAISKNILLTYNSITFGYQSSIAYRIFFELPPYILPIVPNYDNYLKSIINFLFPIPIIFLLRKRVLEEKSVYNKIHVRKNYNKIFLIIPITLMTILIVLSSGLFKYYIMAIGSGSMEKKIYKGDAVIVQKLNEEEIKKLKIGEILVYRYKGVVIVHRIFEIHNKNGNLKIITKGDNNSDTDNWVVEKDFIIGKVNFKIRYIGSPTVWLSEKFK